MPIFCDVMVLSQTPKTISPEMAKGAKAISLGIAPGKNWEKSDIPVLAKGQKVISPGIAK